MLGTTVYNTGWFDLGLNSKVLFGNNANLEVNLEEHDLPSIPQRTRELEMVADISITDTDINSLFLIRSHENQNGDEFYKEHLNVGKGVVSSAYLLF